MVTNIQVVCSPHFLMVENLVWTNIDVAWLVRYYIPLIKNRRFKRDCCSEFDIIYMIISFGMVYAIALVDCKAGSSGLLYLVSRETLVTVS